ncbi:MAG: hypothetical protein ABSH09_03465 [Bryobacteraceae bacterium]
MDFRSARKWRAAFIQVCLGAVIGGCHSPGARREPAIEFTKLPPAGEGSPFKLDTIEGRVSGAQAGQRIVVFARAGLWWVQPLADRPFTEIHGSSWRGTTHPGNAYAALLVEPGYKPPPTTKTLPEAGGNVLAVAVAESATLAHPAVKTLHFSGYEWEIRQTASEPGGARNLYDPANATVDEKGYLHLRIAKKGNDWTSAEAILTRSLGYGSYSFVVQDVSQLEPAAVLSISIWDNTGPSREMDIETSRWGESNSKNAQYVIQPYYVPANVVRFMAPPGVITYSFLWSPGRALFNTVRGPASRAGSVNVSQHVFTSGIPSPGQESTHINLYVFDNKKNPLKHESEVIVENFEYLP